MKRQNLIYAIATSLIALPACGPTEGGGTDSDAGTGSDTDPSGSDGSTTDPQPVECYFGGMAYDDGEEFEDASGCVAYLCQDGVLDTLRDDRTDVAGDLELTTQEAVDEQVCLGTVGGSLRITGTAADLSNLVSLNRVGGELHITGSEATTLQGLEGLGEVGSHIVISDNANLTEMSFQVFMSAFGNVTIQNNDALLSLAGAEFIGGCSTCSTNAAGNPPNLRGDSPSAEPSPGGDGGGLDEPQGGGFYGDILIADNDALTDVSALGNLFFAWASFRLRNNASLVALGPLPLSEVQGDLEISNHAALSSADVESFVATILVSGTTMTCGNLGGEACP